MRLLRGLFPTLIAVCAVVAPLPAKADIILVFGQIGLVNVVTATAAAGVTTISVDDAGIVVSAYAGGGAPFAAFLTLTAASTSAASVGGLGEIDQEYSGTFCITSAIDCGGINYLSGTFDDDFQGAVGGSSANLGATTPPPGAVMFTSSILGPAQLAEERALAFSFSNINPVLAVCAPGPTVCSFTASVAGNMSANNNRQVPEPDTLALLGLALAGVALMRRRA